MKNLKSILPLESYWTLNKIICLFGITLLLILSLLGRGEAKISIDINSPAIQRIRIAIPNFKDQTPEKGQPELASALPEIISNDLDLSGYFLPMDKTAFLEQNNSSLTPEGINFKNWTVIGTDVLLKAGYTCIGNNNIEVEIRLYDAFLEKEVLGKKFLGKLDGTRTLMHRIANEIISTITGTNGMFLSRLVFVNNSTGSKEIYISDFDGNNPTRITSYKSISLLPKWSPQGDRIVFTSFKDGDPMLFLMDISSGQIRKISKTGLIGGACWKADGNALALTVNSGGNEDIITTDMEGKVLEQLTDHWGIDVSPTFSPDGTKMAFVSNRSGNPQIYIKDLQSGNEERITFDLKYCTSPTWSKTGKIAFTAMDDGACDIYTINPDGSNQRRLTQETGNNEDACWSPDGRYIVFSSNRDGGDYHLYIMNANGQNQRRITFLKGEDTAPSWSPF
jgi:TolB protein